MRILLPVLKVKPDKLRNLPPAFVKKGGPDQGGPQEGGTVTAGNSSIIADGAAALVLVSAERASELGLRVHDSLAGIAQHYHAWGLTCGPLLVLQWCHSPCCYWQHSTCTCIWLCGSKCMYVFAHACVHACLYVCVCLSVGMSVCLCLRALLKHWLCRS